jgi:RES domain-containing protein
VYTAEHLSLAMLEYFVHIDPDDPPKDLLLVTVEVPDGVSRASLDSKELPKSWWQTPAPPDLAKLGDNFVRNARATILKFPSALATTEMNWLINPMRSEFSRIRVHATEPFQYDARFFARRH